MHVQILVNTVNIIVDAKERSKNRDEEEKDDHGDNEVPVEAIEKIVLLSTGSLLK